MKKFMRKVLPIALSAMMAIPMVACATPDGDDLDDPFANEKINTSKTQLYVNNFFGGYGANWLAAIKNRYEELHKDDVYEEGKKGVQIYVNNQKVSATDISSQILSNRDEIYFSEYAYYRTLKSEGVLMDITEAVKGDLAPYGDPAESTIEKKLTVQQQEYYGILENGETHYYGLPHYSGYMGITYNVDLFDQEGYYFIDGYENQTGNRRFKGARGNENKAKSKGPDGKTGVIDGVDYSIDDGLPTTYEEFYELIKYIAAGGTTPLTWTGHDYPGYLTRFMEALVADFEGLDQMMLNYNLGDSGVKANDLGTIQNGQFVLDTALPKEITTQNGYETARQQGKYEALKFMEWLTRKDNDKYHRTNVFNGGYSHTNAQEDFLWGGKDGGATPPIAMLIDGIWWESEATSIFNQMSASDSSLSKSNRRFGFMPLPKANAEKADRAATSDKAMTLIDQVYSICFAKANIAEWKKPLALDFIKFVHTNESLVEFNTITDTPKAFNYTMSEEQMSKLSPFGRSVVELKSRSDVVYPYSTNSKYILNQGSFNAGTMYAASSTKEKPVNDMRDHQTTAETYFTQMVVYYKTKWGSLN